MSEKKNGSYEKNFAILENITESLNKDEIAIDDLVEKTREALTAARHCMKILKSQRGEFEKLEKEFADLLKDSEGPAREEDESPRQAGDDQG